MSMSPEAKKALSSTIRALRSTLIEALRSATERRYLLSVPIAQARLGAQAQRDRERLEAHLEALAKAAPKPRRGQAAEPERHRAAVELQAAYTLVNRLVVLRLMEEPTGGQRALRKMPVVKGGWKSTAYRYFGEACPALVGDDRKHGDGTEGYGLLLRLVFDELALELPGIFGPAGAAELVPVPPEALRAAVDALNAPALASCWSDDMTLGWVYQYWNDPAREAIDDKLNDGGKVEPHELASKTQMFTERYMVDWLLQNSLGPIWMEIAARAGWTPEVVADGTLERLEARRIAHRAARRSGEASLTELMPLEGEAEARWAYFLPRPAGEAAPEAGLGSLRALRMIDPAVGSGHFLVVALGLLVPLFEEEARHRGEAAAPEWSREAIVAHIIENTLHGIDLDPRAVQIAAAALWLKARALAPEARPRSMNLVAADLGLTRLSDADSAVMALTRAVQAETGIPEKLTAQLLGALRGADHLGSLLRIDAAIDEAIERAKAEMEPRPAEQLSFPGLSPKASAAPVPEKLKLKAGAKGSLISLLEGFLAEHTSADDLGLRLGGAQLAAGLRLVQLSREGRYDLVVANPPYQGTAKMAETAYVEATYPLGKADLYAAFMLRGLELAKPGGRSAMLTMRNWMFLKQYAKLREHLLEKYDLEGVHDIASGGFDEISAAQVVVSVASAIFRVAAPRPSSLALRSFDEANLTQPGETQRKRAATLCHEGRSTFDPLSLQVVPERPLVYWWDAEMLRLYQSAPLIGKVSPARQGLASADNARFLRRAWEPIQTDFCLNVLASYWQPFVKGAAGKSWMEPVSDLVNWHRQGMEMWNFGRAVIRNPNLYFKRGVAFSMIGSSFTARVHRVPSIFGNKGSSVFPDDLAGAVCAMNSTRARDILESLNPGVGFEVGDVNRLPLFKIDDADAIFAQVEAAFAAHEAHREPSVEFRRPGPSAYRAAQAWAQLAVDRAPGAPLPPINLALEPEPPSDHLSYALGVALGRFDPEGGGALSPEAPAVAAALPGGVLFLDLSLSDADLRDSLGHPAAKPLLAAWEAHGPELSAKRGLRAYLAHDFFRSVHKPMYENKPIHWPLSSADRNFVAYVNIHRMGPLTLRSLLADHLVPTLSRLEGGLRDLAAARAGADAKAAAAAERRLHKATAHRDELRAFVEQVERIADNGPPPAGAACPARERDAPHAPCLDDGVMINSACLYPLLAPQWAEPKRWWAELAAGKGRKDYDWARAAMRYWPSRVAAKCAADPSLAVAHGCFWRMHPARAWAWELRLQDEHAPDARITEAPFCPPGLSPEGPPDTGDEAHRRAFLSEKPAEALRAIEKEAERRIKARRKAQRAGPPTPPLPTFALLEPGLWSSQAAELWELELRLIKLQLGDCRITAPDEPESRAALLAAQPRLTAERAMLLNEAQQKLATLQLGLDLRGRADAGDDGDGEDEDDVTGDDVDEDEES